MLKKSAFAVATLASTALAGFCMYMLVHAQQGINAQGWGLAFMLLGAAAVLSCKQLFNKKQ